MQRLDFDIAIVGGGLAGSLLAISLKRKNKNLSVVILETTARGEMPQKVGESSSDLQAIFLRRFGIDHLLAKHIKKSGLRFLFKTKDNSYSEFSSPSYKSIANGFQLDRKIFDEDLLEYAVELGIVVRRSVQFRDHKKLGPLSTEITLDDLVTNQTYKLKTKWLIDASGRKGSIVKSLDWRKNFDSLNTAASWAYYNIDASQLTKKWDPIKYLGWEEVAIGERANSTTHFMDQGYWAWYFPIATNKVSFGIVYNKNLHHKRNPGELYNHIISENKLIYAALGENPPENFRHLDHLAYTSKHLVDRGIASIGDASAFLDPLFSPGMELCVQQVLALSDLLCSDFHYTQLPKWKKYEDQFLSAFETRRFIYEGRYQVMGEFDLFTNWTRLDFFGYISFYVLPSAYFPAWIKRTPRFNNVSKFLYQLYKKRLIAIYQHRKNRGRLHEAKPAIQFSGVRVPMLPMAPFKVLELFLRWFLSYLRIELNELLENFQPTRQKYSGRMSGKR